MIKKRLSKVTTTQWGVLAFIVVLILALGASNKAKADEVYFNLSHSTFGSEFTIPSVGYRFDSNWDIGLGFFGDGETRKGPHSRSPWAAVSYIVDPNWHGYFMRIGVAYTPDINLVGDANFRLGIGWDFGVWEVEAQHFSSAGTSKRNTGVDGLGLTAKVKILEW